MSQSTTVPVNVGLVLNINGEVEKLALSCINMSLSDFYNSISHYKTRLIVTPISLLIGIPANCYTYYFINFRE